MNTTTTTNPILPAAGVRRRPANVRNAHPQGFHDVSPLNPTGRGEIDTYRDAKAKLLQCRKNIKIATFNVQTLAIREVDNILQKKTEEMTSNMRKYNISIYGIQEHIKVHSADREQKLTGTMLTLDMIYTPYQHGEIKYKQLMVAWVS